MKNAMNLASLAKMASHAKNVTQDIIINMKN